MASEPNSFGVHLGFWTNWSHGKVQGATITLTQRNGGFLIAFLAIFVGMVGKSFWRLGCFCMHRYFSSSDPEDGLYHQRQAILRNSDTAQDAAWRLFISLLSWRSGARARRPIARLFPIILGALLISSAFGIASIFSSHVTTDTTSEVLLTGARCGVVNQKKPHNITKMLELLLPYYTERASQVLNYGLQCYTNSSNVDGCNLYIKPQLPIFANREAGCPFSDGICKMNTGNLILDTGLLDSLDHFGINTSPKERFQMRIVQHCAPIVTEGYTETYNETDLGPMVRYLYGPNIQINGTRCSMLSYAPPDPALYPTGTNDFIPIPPLTRQDADVSLMYVSAPGIRFSAPVDDPWLSAHKPATNLVEHETNQTRPSYIQDEPAGIMACATQYQYCNPSTKECEPLRGLIDPRKGTPLKKIFPNKRQFDTLSWADGNLVSNFFSSHGLVGFIGASALRARYGLSYGYQGPLPSNQWQLEVEHLLKGTLASVQDVWVTMANGAPHVLDDFLQPPDANDTVARSMCANQKIMSQKYSSFNVLGISLILILGAWIMVMDIGLEPAVAWWQRRRYLRHHMQDKFFSAADHPLYAALEWSHTSTLQLQRLAHEEAGYGAWSKGDGDCPVTMPGQNLGSLDLRDIKHPVIKREEKWAKEWEDVMKIKEFGGIRRTDTGLETLVEDVQAERMQVGVGKGGGRDAVKEEEMDVIVTVVEAREREGGR
ncbi:uncharacterized protein BDR25DRAFT_385987 [Lindgomyces ingoldianus]|uniref:Uncharacterized protein n=1 Tax=Lindgomyces ingoldianus TaxID=673940 RepID=A0ACB6R5T1_9PLEO|nr:uncharacterized protein BDR25DRAFT_385987 [Lindgomyces ingoldianus]KAF2474435.1 hypothetical protein BDR25DRAFT_385987 [Lindgomyces ingoldianus]